MEILNTAIVQRNFRVQANFEEPIMSKFISFMRFVEFDENIALLYQIKGQWQSRRRPHPEDSDDEPSNVFQADEIPTISKHNERKVWRSIKNLSAEGLARYPQAYEEDMELLKNPNLSFNERNCILFRSGEKEILIFLMEMADYVLDLLNMKFKDAKKHTQNLPAKMDSCRDYL